MAKNPIQQNYTQCPSPSEGRTLLDKLGSLLFHIFYKFPIYSLNFVFNTVTFELPEK